MSTSTLTSLNFPVEERKLNTTVGGLEVPAKAIVRADTNRVLGVVGENYKLIQHGEVVKAVEKFLPVDKMSRSVSVSHEGARIFVTYKLQGIKPVEPKVGDIVSWKVQAFNGHDGGLIAGWRFLLERLACLNGMTTPNAISYIGVRHTSYANIDISISEFKAKYEQVRQATDLWKTWTKIKPKDPTLNRYLNGTFGKLIGTQIRDRYETKEEKTVWGAFNAVTDYTSHRMKLNKKSRTSIESKQFFADKEKVEKFYRVNWN